LLAYYYKTTQFHAGGILSRRKYILVHALTI
jgi:hypothetical protein